MKRLRYSLGIYKKVALCVAALCCAVALQAQISLGVKGGATFGNHGLSEGSAGWANGYHAGLALNVYIVEFSFGGFAVQPEVLFNRKGANVQVLDGTGTGHWEEQVEKLNYVEAPLGLVYLLNFGNVVPYVAVAPYYSFLVSQKSEFRGEDSKTDRYRDNDYGVKFGGGVELRKFQISAAYTMGLCNIAKSGSKSIYNRSVEVSLGYFFLQ